MSIYYARLLLYLNIDKIIYESIFNTGFLVNCSIRSPKKLNSNFLIIHHTSIYTPNKQNHYFNSIKDLILILMY